MAGPADREPLWKLDEVAKLTKQSRRTVERHVAKGLLRVVHPGGYGRPRVTSSDLEAYMNGPDGGGEPSGPLITVVV